METNRTEVPTTNESAVDPLFVINNLASLDNKDMRKLKWLGVLSTSITVPATLLADAGLQWLGLPVEPMMVPAAATVTNSALLCAGFNRSKNIRKKTNNGIKVALEDLKLMGIAEDEVVESNLHNRLISDEWEKWFVAKGARATKLFLAQRGILDAYEEGKWLIGLKSPEWLKPTAVELEEVTRVIEKDRKELDEFVGAIAADEIINVECGTEMLAESNNVYHFPDKRNTKEYKTRPLIDVVRGMAGTQDEIQSFGIRNGFAFYQGESMGIPYNGLHSPEGRLRLADFFGKPVRVWTGGEVIPDTKKVYGVEQPDFYIDGGLGMYLDLGFNRNIMFHYDEVSPTKTRLENIGLVLSK